MPDMETVISKLEKEVQRTYSTKTTVFQNGEKVSEEINTHREPCVRIPIEMADKILAMLKEQEAVVRQWTKEIADNQLANAPKDSHEFMSLDEHLENEYKRGIWDGLQIAWDIISEGR